MMQAYRHAEHIIQSQKEPQNQGTWNFMHQYLETLIQKNQTLSYAGLNAAVAAGFARIHIAQQ